jgi:hypothetical protein
MTHGVIWVEDVACVLTCRHDELMENGYGVFTKISLGLDSNHMSFDDMQAYFLQKATHG